MRRNTSHNFQAVWFISGLAVLALAAFFGAKYYIDSRYSAPATNSQPISAHIREPELVNLEDKRANEIPKTKLLQVPFTPQAPTANWDELHNEACEEASAIMASAYFEENTSSTLSPDFVEKEISKLTDWQQTNFGYNLDTTTAETAVMITKVYGLKAKVISFPTSEEIKQLLAEGNLVIFSANGQKLGNPNYKQPGPIHHMLLLRGYNESNFITNDSGTKKGLNYPYDYETLKTAAADWDHSQNTVDDSKKLAIIVSAK